MAKDALSRRRFICLGSAACAAFFESSQNRESFAQERRSIRIATLRDISDLDPLSSTGVEPYILRSIWPPLTAIDTNVRDGSKWRPHAADISQIGGSDRRQNDRAFIDVRPNHRYRWALSGGYPNAEDLKRGIERVLQDRRDLTTLHLGMIDSVELINSQHCRIWLRSADNRLFTTFFAHPGVSPLNDELASALSASTARQYLSQPQPNLLGSYIPEPQQSPDDLFLKRNTRVVMSKDAADLVHIKRYRDRQTAIRGLNSNEVDVVPFSGPDGRGDVEAFLRSFPGAFTLTSRNVNAVTYVSFDTGGESNTRNDNITSDIRVRTALRMAIDAETLVGAAFGGGTVTPTSRFIPQEFLSSSGGARQNLELSRQLLRDAGVRPMQRFDLIHSEATREVADGLIKQLSILGIVVVPQLGEVLPARQLRLRNRGALILARTPVVRHHSDILLPFVTNSLSNVSLLSWPELDAFHSRMVYETSPAVSTFDRAIEFINRAEPGIPLFQERAGAIHRRQVQLPEILPDGGFEDLETLSWRT